MSSWDDDKPKRKAIPKAVKDTVWSKYIGATKAEGKCYVCSRTIHISSFEGDLHAMVRSLRILE